MSWEAVTLEYRCGRCRRVVSGSKLPAESGIAVVRSKCGEVTVGDFPRMDIDGVFASMHNHLVPDKMKHECHDGGLGIASLVGITKPFTYNTEAEYGT